MSTPVAWEHELQSWLEPFLTHLHHPARRRMCPLYVAGLIGPGERKSVQPIASRDSGGRLRRRLAWAVGIPRTQKVYSPDVVLTWPVAPRGRPRQRPVPNVRPLAAQDALELKKWRTVTWRAGERSHQHLPGHEEVWLVGERRRTGEQKYYLSNLPATTTLKTLAAAIKARWLCEQAHQQLKEELGLDHFEGRSWSGLHRHALMSMVAFLYLQQRRIRAAKRGKKDERPTASAQPSGRTHGHDRPLPPAPLSTMSLPVQTANRATQL